VSALSERIGAVLAVDPGADAIEFGGRWHTWGELAGTVGPIADLVAATSAQASGQAGAQASGQASGQAGSESGAQAGLEVGVLLRNRPASIGFLLGVLAAGGCVVTINPGRGVQRTRDDIAALDLPLLCGDPADLAELVPADAPATTVAASQLGSPLDVRPGPRAAPDPGDLRPGTAVRMLTSGTTGPPKRVDLTYSTLERVLVGAKHYESNRDDTVRLRTGVAVVNSPLVHLGGLFRVLQCIADGRSFSFLERFSVDGWVDAVRRHRPATASLVPAAMRMVLEADPDPADLASLRSVVSGTAPLDPDDADAFTARYGVPVLITYAATEFGGSVAGWNVDDHRRFWSAKRGSVGRAHAGCQLRVVDPASGQPVGSDVEGVLEVRAGQLGDAGWVRTTDLARIDDDGFVWILGRADHAIIRGGFKVRPEDVKAALERHPAVRGAAVVSRDDHRLGAVPVAAVELRGEPGPTGDRVEADDLLAYAGTVLAPYEIPTDLRIVEALPRTDSGKVDLVAVSSLFDDVAADA
jgi:acyl-coenzyme A synthetase/AMP-(fatty) acid ligase